jgi:hypothetical protein
VSIRLSELQALAKRSETENKKFIVRLKKKRPKDIDIKVSAIHEKVFQNINCLDCANCCKSISPIITDKDIERISKYLKLRPSVFTEKYLHLDNDNDYVYNDTPCPFLDKGNYCMIYSVRPKACSEYPHTDKSKFINLLNITVKNTYYCPAVYEIVERLKKEMNKV